MVKHRLAGEVIEKVYLKMRILFILLLSANNIICYVKVTFEDIFLQNIVIAPTVQIPRNKW